ncbi:MAG: spoIIIJ-associated protein [Oceanicoccus sp.]|jgi:spoIIIJ-associated protein
MEKEIKQFVSEFLVHLGIDFTDLEVETLSENKLRVNVVSDEPSLLIGHHGENLIAMQKLIKVVVHKRFGEAVEVAFDVDSYRKRQEENVLAITKQKIEEVRSTRVQATLPPMSPYFRRVVHLFVRDDEYTDLETESMGEGNYRQVAIKPKA